MRLVELFGGIGSATQSLKNIGIDLDVLDYVEIDKFAVESYNALNDANYKIQDISNWDKDVENVDLIMHGSPCQSFSVSGKQEGGDKDSGTRSSLMWETVRIINKVKPEFILWENVKNVLSKKHRHNFEKYIEELEGLGYNSYYEVLNAKHFEVPQNRERLLCLSIRNDIDKGFEFPEGQELKLRLKDVLEETVDEKYYLSEDKVKNLVLNSKGDNVKEVGFIKRKNGTQHQSNTVYDPEGLSCTLQARDYKDPQKIVAQRGRYTEDGKIVQKLEVRKDGITNTITTVQKDNMVLIKNATKKGYQEAFDGDGVSLEFPNSKTRRGRVQGQMSPTLQCSDSKGVIDGLKIRKLTPKECWRLMGFKDKQFEKAEEVCSNSQLYKQAGNSIVVNVLEAIFEKMREYGYID